MDWHIKQMVPLIFLALFFMFTFNVEAKTKKNDIEFAFLFQLTPCTQLNKEMNGSFNDYITGPNRLAAGIQTPSLVLLIGMDFWAAQGSQKIDEYSIKRFLTIEGPEFSLAFRGEIFYGGTAMFNGYYHMKYVMENSKKEKVEESFNGNAIGTRIFFGSKFGKDAKGFVEFFIMALDIADEEGYYSDEDGNFNHVGISAGRLF